MYVMSEWILGYGTGLHAAPSSTRTGMGLRNGILGLLGGLECLFSFLGPKEKGTPSLHRTRRTHLWANVVTHECSSGDPGKPSPPWHEVSAPSMITESDRRCTNPLSPRMGTHEKITMPVFLYNLFK